MVDETRTVSLNQAVYHRNYQRARARALVRLSRAFQTEYKQYLQEEREKDEAMGKTWLGFDSNTGGPITIQSYKDATEGAVDPCDNGAHQSYYGGEE
jgi:hypothetical protein